jgi:hypothetical protein
VPSQQFTIEHKQTRNLHTKQQNKQPAQKGGWEGFIPQSIQPIKVNITKTGSRFSRKMKAMQRREKRENSQLLAQGSAPNQPLPLSFTPKGETLTRLTVQ